MLHRFIKRLALRFVGEHDQVIYNQLVESAEKNHRSLNGEIVHILEEHFAREQKKADRSK